MSEKSFKPSSSVTALPASARKQAWQEFFSHPKNKRDRTVCDDTIFLGLVDRHPKFQAEYTDTAERLTAFVIETGGATEECREKSAQLVGEGESADVHGLQ
jgi:hypothetical protein